MREGAVISTATHFVRTGGRCRHAQGRSNPVEGKLPDDSHISIPIFSCGNNEEYIAHIVAVLRIIKQKGLPKTCRMYAKAVAKRQEVLKNLQEASESRDTVSTPIDIMACKVEIEQTTQILQESQRAHDKAIATLYEQLRNLLSGDAQSQWDRVCREMHEDDSWAAVNGKITEGRRPRTWMSSLDCLDLHKLTSLVLTQLRNSDSTFSKQCASPRGPLCDSISRKWEC